VLFGNPSSIGYWSSAAMANQYSSVMFVVSYVVRFRFGDAFGDPLRDLRDDAVPQSSKAVHPLAHALRDSGDAILPATACPARLARL
jgi:hypothetical protein